MDVSTMAAHRLVLVLAHLCAGDAVFINLLLQPRDERGALYKHALVALQSAERKPGTSPITISSEASGAVSVFKSSVTGAVQEDGAVAVKPGAVVSRLVQQSSAGVGDGLSPASDVQDDLVVHGSSNSLLEEVVSLFSRHTFTSDVADLGLLSHLIEIITEPLERLPDASAGERNTNSAVCSETEEGEAVAAESSPIEDASTESEPAAPATALATIREGREGKDKNTISVAVPRVVLARDALSSLCDVLLSDLCSKKIFSNVISAISRLSKIPQNNSVLLELIFDIIVELA